MLRCHSLRPLIETIPYQKGSPFPFSRLLTVTEESGASTDTDVSRFFAVV